MPSFRAIRRSENVGKRAFETTAALVFRCHLSCYAHNDNGRQGNIFTLKMLFPL